ncbi:hypothetical protein L9F63_009712, partial [Diploptera punctata]
LLRRLSRSQNTVFCGRILLFLAKFFLFSERSGLNIVSEFNLDNLTEFGGENSEDKKPDAKLRLDITTSDTEVNSKTETTYKKTDERFHGVGSGSKTETGRSVSPTSQCRA